MKKSIYIIMFTALAFFVTLGSANAFVLSGTVLNSTGSPQNATNITITEYSFGAGPPTVVNVTSTLSNASGQFVVDFNSTNQDANYKITIIAYDENGNATQIGPTLPPFPLDAFMFGLNGSTYYLQEAGVLRLDAINESGGQVNFTYMVTDTSLGFPIIEPDFNNMNSASATAIVPLRRNYSIMFVPENAPPITHSITNLSAYNTTIAGAPYIANITANTSISWVNVTGYINSSTGLTSFESLEVINFLIIGGGGSWVPLDAVIPRNMTGTDILNNNTGLYNISLPGTTGEGFEVLLVFFGTNGTERLAIYQNVTAVIGSGDINMNLTLRPLAGAPGLFEPKEGTNVTTNVTTFALIDGDNVSESIGQAFVDMKMTLDNGREVSFAANTNQQGTLNMPLLNDTQVTLMIFSQNSAPVKKKITVTNLNANSTINITLYNMDMRAPNGTSLKDVIEVHFYKSNSTCDVPEPLAGCELSSFDNATDFNPLQAMLGGAVSLRLAHAGSGPVVHYVNVDLLASGPPDAQFTETRDANLTSGASFGELWKFGSMGPDIYDYILVGVPYSESSLNESAAVNVSIPYLYDIDNNWEIIWNTSVNGTNATLLAGNYSDYSEHQSEWQVLLDGVTCHTNASSINTTAPCYINTTGNEIWLRIPHFSGVGPEISGSVSSSSTGEDTGDSDSTSTTTGGGSGSTAVSNKVTNNFGPIEAGETVDVDIDNINIAFTQLSFSLATSTDGSTYITVESKGDTNPTNKNIPDATVYQYLDVSKSLVLNIADAEIVFAVDRSWVDSNNLDYNTIKLWRFDGTNWNALETTYLGGTSTKYKYSAKTADFSYFAIAAQAKAVVEPVIGGPEEEEGITVAPSEEEFGIAASEGKKYWSSINAGVWLLIAIVVVGTILYTLYQKGHFSNRITKKSSRRRPSLEHYGFKVKRK